MQLRVVAAVATPGNHLPDQYALTDAKGERYYRFVPHHGCVRCGSLEEAMEIVRNYGLFS